MHEQGILDNSLVKSLGIFTVGLFILLLVFLFYYSIKYCKCCGKIREMLYKKLFWSGPLRYVIVGYLNLLGE